MQRVLVVSETRLYREGLAQSLAGQPGIVVAGAVGFGEAVGQVRCLRADIALVDLGHPDGIEAVRAIKAAGVDVRVVAVALPDTEGTIISSVEAGIDGYLTRDGTLRELVETISSVRSGEVRASPRVVASLFRRVALLATQCEDRGPAARLTRREREIVGLIDQGLSNKEIASRLNIELSTVKNHVHNILDKLRVRRRADAAIAARRLSVDSPQAARVTEGN